MQQPRKEFGHYYLQHAVLGFWYNLEGKPVQIFPPTYTRAEWLVIVPVNRESLVLTGNECVGRAFAMAAGYITQSD